MTTGKIVNVEITINSEKIRKALADDIREKANELNGLIDTALRGGLRVIIGWKDNPYKDTFIDIYEVSTTKKY